MADGWVEETGKVEEGECGGEIWRDGRSKAWRKGRDREESRVEI